MIPTTQKFEKLSSDNVCPLIIQANIPICILCNYETMQWSITVKMINPSVSNNDHSSRAVCS